MLEFTKRVIAIRKSHPAFHRSKFFQGRRIRGTDVRDIMWYRHDGEEMTDEDWNNPVTASVGLFLAGLGLREVDPDGAPLVDDDFFIVLNGSDQPLPFTVPRATREGTWRLQVDTNDDHASEEVEQGEKTELAPRSLKLFMHDAGRESL